MAYSFLHNKIMLVFSDTGEIKSPKKGVGKKKKESEVKEEKAFTILQPYTQTYSYFL